MISNRNGISSRNQSRNQSTEVKVRWVGDNHGGKKKSGSEDGEQAEEACRCTTSGITWYGMMLPRRGSCARGNAASRASARIDVGGALREIMRRLVTHEGAVHARTVQPRKISKIATNK